MDRRRVPGVRRLPGEEHGAAEGGGQRDAVVGRGCCGHERVGPARERVGRPPRHVGLERRRRVGAVGRAQGGDRARDGLVVGTSLEVARVGPRVERDEHRHRRARREELREPPDGVDGPVDPVGVAPEPPRERQPDLVHEPHAEPLDGATVHGREFRRERHRAGLEHPEGQRDDRVCRDVDARVGVDADARVAPLHARDDRAEPHVEPFRERRGDEVIAGREDDLLAALLVLGIEVRGGEFRHVARELVFQLGGQEPAEPPAVPRREAVLDARETDDVGD